jgi:PTS system nitrogen regulatory IIA component
MQLRDILKMKSVTIDLESKEKEDVLKELVGLISDEIPDKEHIHQILVERENLGSTGIGQGIAVPHGKTDETDKIVAALGISKKGVEFNSLDGELVYIFFLLIAPKASAGPHLKALARISRILRDSSFCDILRKSKDVETAYKLIIKEDEKTK